MPKSDPLRCSACNISPRDEALPTSKLSLLAQQIQVWKFEFRIVARNSSGLVYRQKCRMVPEQSFTNHQSEHLPSRVAATKAAANVQQFVEVLKTEEEKWAMIPVGGSHTLTINKPTWIQDYLLQMLSQTADSLTIRKVDLKLCTRNLDGFSMVSTPVNCRKSCDLGW